MVPDVDHYIPWNMYAKNFSKGERIYFGRGRPPAPPPPYATFLSLFQRETTCNPPLSSNSFTANPSLTENIANLI